MVKRRKVKTRGRGAQVRLSDFDLAQLDEQRVTGLPLAQKDVLLVKLLSDLKDARDRLKATSRTSSRPPSSDAPWTGVKPGEEGEGKETASESEAKACSASDSSEPSASSPSEDVEASSATPSPVEASGLEPASTSSEPGKAGRRKGGVGHSRELSLPVSATIYHRPEVCSRCERSLEGKGCVNHTGHYVLDIELGEVGTLRGLQVRHDKHVYGEVVCDCGHRTRSAPGRSPAEALWEVGLSEWHLVGPQLSSLIVCLSQELGVSRRRIQGFLGDWLGVTLSTAVIDQCIREMGRAVEPLEEVLVEELQAAVRTCVDETPWKEWGLLLWMWVFSTPTLCVYFIGYRSREILDNVLGEHFGGWLMSDGYQVYRHFQHRLRCWAHLLRKALGLEASLHASARHFGQHTHHLLSELIEAVNAARDAPPGEVNLPERFRQRLEAFRVLCEQHRDSAHEKTRALAREFLNDWEAVWVVLAHPQLPMTNNEAERALRHWVIIRRLMQGTRSAEGTRAVALLASIIETCRRRNALPWPYLASVLAERRKGNPAPALPAPAV